MASWDTVVLIIAALFLSKVFDYITSKIIKKVDTDYVTGADQKKFEDEVMGKLGLISGILLVMASGKEVSQELINRLITGGR